MPNARQIRPADHRWIALFTGGPGSGKTSAAATWPRPYIACADPNGVVPLAGRDWVGPEDVEYDYYLDADPLKPEAFRRLLAFIDEQRRKPKYETYVFDSITTIAQIAMSEVQRIRGSLGSAPTIDDFRQMADKLDRFFHTAVALPGNVIFTSHLEIEKDEDTGVVWTLVLIPGSKKMPHRIPIYFDEIWLFEVTRGEKNEPAYNVHTVAPAKRMYSKTRRRGIPASFTWDRFKESMYDKVMSYVRAAEGGENGTETRVHAPATVVVSSRA